MVSHQHQRIRYRPLKTGLQFQEKECRKFKLVVRPAALKNRIIYCVLCELPLRNDAPDRAGTDVAAEIQAQRGTGRRVQDKILA